MTIDDQAKSEQFLVGTVICKASRHETPIGNRAPRRESDLDCVQ
jgi:hypothetical protein